MTELDQAAFGAGAPDQPGNAASAGELPPPQLPPTEPEPRPNGPSRKPLAAIAAVFGLLMIASIVVVGFLGPSTPHASGGSPGAVVQAWASAMEAGDYGTADTYLSERLRSEGTTSQYMSPFGSMYGGTSQGTSTNGNMPVLTVTNVSTNGDTATVAILMTIDSSVSDSSSKFSIQGSISMVMESGGWKVDSNIEPNY